MQRRSASAPPAGKKLVPIASPLPLAALALALVMLAAAPLLRGVVVRRA